MRSVRPALPRLGLLSVLLLLLPLFSAAQTGPARPRIVGPIDETRLSVLKGNTHPLALPGFDRGAVPADLPMQRMLLILKRSPEQEGALELLLDQQQDKASPNYHRWLTPDEFGATFGPAEQDLQTVASWLASHGFELARVSRGGTVIEFSGTADQVRQAFHAEIHQFVVNGEQHWANASDPQIPEALAPVVAGINSLHNFPKEPNYQLHGEFSRWRDSGEIRSAMPEYTYPNSNACHFNGNCYAVGPYDFATIYNVLPLWNANPPVDGTGQTIAIVGESDINIQDVRDFRTLFGLPANDPQIIVDGPDPGIVADLETEADLDVEWSGAVAKGATIKYVAAASTNSTSGIDLLLLYVVDNNLAPVVSESFSNCELFLGTAGNAFENAVRQQAAAQGITAINSSGDEGSARCDAVESNTPATHGLAVSGLASSPFGVAVGGTDFLNFGPNFTSGVSSAYWFPTNDIQQASARGYIPEVTWNSTCTNNVFVLFGYGSNPEASCNNPSAANFRDVEAGGGGKSACTVSDGADLSSCSGGYAKPSWQSGPGVPNDGVRDIPDVSLFASPGFTDSFYIVCEADLITSGTSCNPNISSTNFVGIGGTSAAAPAFAGLMALVNQYTGSNGQGVANYVLYRLPLLASQTGLNCAASAGPASGCIFNDVTSGTISVPCARYSPNCYVANGADNYGVLSGYDAGAGYDEATGLGTINAANLVQSWNLASFSASVTTLTLNNGNAVNLVHGQSVPATVTVTGNGGTPSGAVSLVANSASGEGVDEMTLGSNGSVSWETNRLPGGNYSVVAHYGGDGVFGSSNSTPPVSVSVSPETSSVKPSVFTSTQLGQFLAACVPPRGRRRNFR